MDNEAYNTVSFSYIIVKAVGGNIRDYSFYCNVIALNSMFRLNCDCVLIISLYREEFLRLVVISGISLYR